MLPPAKTLCGPVGAFYRQDYNLQRLKYLHNAQRVLQIQAIGAYYTQNPQSPFVCPNSECDSQFENGRSMQAWALHVCEAYHCTFELPTETLEMLFSKQDACWARLKQDNEDHIARLRLEWGEEGSEQRRKREEDFLHQLQHDPAYALEKPPRESHVWRFYRVEMDNEKTVYNQ